jgi:hypothetical protein
VVEDGIAHAFDHLVMPLGWVLMLMVQFTLPGRDTISAKDVACSIAGFHLGGH